MKAPYTVIVATLSIFLLTSTIHGLYKDDYFDKKVLYDNSELLQLSEYEVIRLRKEIRDEEIRKNTVQSSYNYYTQPQQKRQKKPKRKTFQDIQYELKKRQTPTHNIQEAFVDFIDF